MKEQKLGTDRFGNRYTVWVATFSAVLLLLAVVMMAAPVASPAAVFVGVSINVAPPPLPVYEQPPIPGPGFIWTPGYWAWDPVDGYYWVPGTWILAPFIGALWTPGYWGWSEGIYVWHAGYWGTEVGFYGGVNYGFGYIGTGYAGGYWRHGAFSYNRTVNNVTNVTNITNVYNKTVINNVNTTNVSFNGGTGGTTVQPTKADIAMANAKHTPPTAEQVTHEQVAQKDPNQHVAVNQGKPVVAASPKPGALKDPGVTAVTKAVPLKPEHMKPEGGKVEPGPKGENPQPAGKEKKNWGNAPPQMNEPRQGGKHPAGPMNEPGVPGLQQPAEPRQGPGQPGAGHEKKNWGGNAPPQMNEPRQGGRHPAGPMNEPGGPGLKQPAEPRQGPGQPGAGEYPNAPKKGPRPHGPQKNEPEDEKGEVFPMR